jgi:sugar phosphate isomerase/epimerase
MESSRALGASAVVVHRGRRVRGVPTEGARERCAGSLRALAGAAAEHGLELRVENMPRGPGELGRQPAELASLAAAAGIAACWDLGHARTLLAEPDLTSLAACVREVHAHDNRGDNDDHRPLGGLSSWATAPLRALAPHAERATFEHRTVADGLASLHAGEDLLRG